MEHPNIAIQLSARFPSAQVIRDVRGLLLEYPEKAIGEPDALQILLGSALSTNLGPQLKVIH